MRIKYLGTAASEGIPAVFCECENCQKAKKLGGRNIRTRSQALIDNKILIDFPMDTYMHYLMFDFPLARIKTCLITHSHSDHLYPDEIISRKNMGQMQGKHGLYNIGPSHIENRELLTFYSAQSGHDMLKDVIIKHHIENDVAVVLIKPQESFEVEGYTITPLEASHDPASTPVIFLIEKDGKSLLYSNDTSEYPEETWEYLKGKRIDFISMDGTECVSEASYVGHLTLERNVKMRERMYELGIADKHTEFALTHFSHNGGNVTYDEFVEIAEEYNYIVAYDGMEYQIAT